MGRLGSLVAACVTELPGGPAGLRGGLRSGLGGWMNGSGRSGWAVSCGVEWRVTIEMIAGSPTDAQ